VTPSPPDLHIEPLLRELAPQVLGAVVRRFRDFPACEDAVQESLIAAAAQWPRDGIPGNPRGWLIQVALRRMTDHVRSETSRRSREAVAAGESPVTVAPALDSEPSIDPDERLSGHHRLDAVRAHLLERAGQRAAAVSLYRTAAEKTTSVPERDYLRMRAARLSEAL
jgi:predicted RNA polymerase sigma factor